VLLLFRNSKFFQCPLQNAAYSLPIRMTRWPPRQVLPKGVTKTPPSAPCTVAKSSMPHHSPRCCCICCLSSPFAQLQAQARTLMHNRAQIPIYCKSKNKSTSRFFCFVLQLTYRINISVYRVYFTICCSLFCVLKHMGNTVNIQKQRRNDT